MSERVPWLDYLSNHIGLKEVPGPKHNPTIVQWGKDAGIPWWNNDDDAWCAVAVNASLVNSGYPSTKSALARSFARYGTRLAKPVRGAIVVFPRGLNPMFGHVGIVDEIRSDGTVVVVNGNVSNMVKRSVFRTASILPDGIRWPPGAPVPASAGRAVADAPLGERALQAGAQGADVEQLQRELNVLGYGLTVDGRFGPKTRDAVVAFETRRGLEADGVVDAATLAALNAAAAERRARDDKVVTAQRAATPIAGAGAAVTATAVISTSVDMAKDVKSLDDGTVVGLCLVLAVVVAACGAVIWRFAMQRAGGTLREGTL